MVSAFDFNEGLTLIHPQLRQRNGANSDKKSVRYFSLLTADALHCQVETLNKVVDKGDDFLVLVKLNQ